jgi:hypothetical protein
VTGLEDAGRIGRPKADLDLSEAERAQLTRWARPIRSAIGVRRRARVATCSGSGEVWMTVRVIIVTHRADVPGRIGVRIACSDDSEQGGDDGKSAVSEGDLR